MEFTLPFHAVTTLEEGLEFWCDNLASFEDDPAYAARDTEPSTRWKLTLYYDTKPNLERLTHRIITLATECEIAPPTPMLKHLPPHDWVSDVQKHFVPLRIGRFFVHSATYQGPIPTETIPLQVNASLAFGTGEHETTSGCLLMLERLAKRHRFTRMLDMGCGTGILAIAMAKLWKHSILAVDIDSNAVRITRENARLNQVSRYIHAAESNGYLSKTVRANAPYDLITANILADPLVAFAKELRRNLAPGGIAVLSGLLTAQENRVLMSHRAQGLRLVGRYRMSGWSVLIIKR